MKHVLCANPARNRRSSKWYFGLSKCLSCFIESQENQVGEVSNITKFTQIYVYIGVNHSNLSHGQPKWWWLYGNPPENAWKFRRWGIPYGLGIPLKKNWRFKALENMGYDFYITFKNEGNVGSKKYRSMTIDVTVHAHYILKLGTLLPTSPWKIPVVSLQKLRHVTVCFCCPPITWKESSTAISDEKIHRVDEIIWQLFAVKK